MNREGKNTGFIRAIILIAVVALPIIFLLYADQKISAYIKENLKDVIELNDNNVISGRIAGEAPKNIYFKNINGREEKIDRGAVKNIRKPTQGELNTAKKVLIKNKDFIKMILGVRGSKRISDMDSERYNSEVAAASRAHSNLEKKLADKKLEEEQKEQENKEQASAAARQSEQTVRFPEKKKMRKTRTRAGGGTEEYWE